MANFRTHIGVAAVGSGLLATMGLGAEIVRPQEVILLSVAGTLGGILPDIDLDHSSPTRVMFTALALVASFLAVFKYAGTYSILELWFIGGFTFGVVRYLGGRMFANLTVHRGIFHSVAAGLFFWFLSTALGYAVFDFNRMLSWMFGLFVFIGYVLHLCLDEMYSVDFMNTRVKRSFGTALKLIDYKNAWTSVLMVVAMLLMYFMTPSAASFRQAIFQDQVWHNIMQRFLPHGGWFTL
jgi:hypothetical protein